MRRRENNSNSSTKVEIALCVWKDVGIVLYIAGIATVSRVFNRLAKFHARLAHGRPQENSSSSLAVGNRPHVDWRQHFNRRLLVWL